MVCGKGIGGVKRLMETPCSGVVMLTFVGRPLERWRVGTARSGAERVRVRCPGPTWHAGPTPRSEERRVGNECRSRWSAYP